MTNFERVRKFMETFGQEVKKKAEFPNKKIMALRYDLIKEELEELKIALDKKKKEVTLVYLLSKQPSRFFRVELLIERINQN